MTSNDDTTRSVPTTAPTDSDPAEPVRTSAPAPGSGPAPAAGQAPVAQAAVAAAPRTYLEGPAPFPILLGLLGILVAGGVLLAELTDLTLPWTDLGPWSAVIVGLVVLVVGAIGLSGSRRQG